MCDENKNFNCQKLPPSPKSSLLIDLTKIEGRRTFREEVLRAYFTRKIRDDTTYSCSQLGLANCPVNQTKIEEAVQMGMDKAEEYGSDQKYDIANEANYLYGLKERKWDDCPPPMGYYDYGKVCDPKKYPSGKKAVKSSIHDDVISTSGDCDLPVSQNFSESFKYELPTDSKSRESR